MSKSSTGKPHSGYHCDYCRRELNRPPLGISLDSIDPITYIRVRCAECVDYDLCLGCYSNGKYTYPHQPTHNYMIKRPLNECIVCGITVIQFI